MTQKQLDRIDYENGIFVLLKNCTLAEENSDGRCFSASVKEGIVYVDATNPRIIIKYIPTDESKDPEFYENGITLTLRQLANLQINLDSVSYSKDFKVTLEYLLKNSKP